MVSEALKAIDRELAAQYGKDGEASIYPLDKELGIHRYQRYSAYFEYQAAQIAAKTVYRTTAMAINALTPVTISHQQVGNIIKHVGERYAEWEKEQQQDKGGHITELKKPEVLYVEGDGLELKEQKGKHMEVHRFQIAEGVKEHKNRRECRAPHKLDQGI